MNIEYIQNRLKESFFFLEPSNSLANVEFDFVAKRSKGITGGEFYVGIKFIDLLEGGTAKEWQIKYDQIFKEKKGFWKADPFCLCIMAEVATPSSAQMLINHAKKMGHFPCLIFIGSKELGIVAGDASFPILNKNKLIKEIYTDLSSIFSDATYLSS